MVTPESIREQIKAIRVQSEDDMPVARMEIGFVLMEIGAAILENLQTLVAAEAQRGYPDPKVPGV